MDIAQAKQRIKDAVESYLAVDDDGICMIDPARQRPLFIIGAPGIGKTAIMAQIATELGIGLVSYSMTHHTRQSALGLPFIIEKSYDDASFEVSEYTMSEIIASVYDFRERTGLDQGILFLDEINCVSETLYPSMLQFLQFKTFGRHRLPENWVVVCAGNPPEYNKSVHEFDIVTLDRLRKIEVEPDYDAWKSYAADIGVHPAIMTFLDVKRDCFYSVESTPSGKRFVTARGWVDLSDSISVCEKLGKPIDVSLIAQFLQDDEISERFAVYYDLFKKYRSDYEVESILEGSASDSVLDRARLAGFDERIALLGLMVDSLANKSADVLARRKILSDVRDILKAEKPAILAGTSIDEAIQPYIDAHVKSLDNLKGSALLSSGKRRHEQRVIKLLKDLAHGSALALPRNGSEAFSAVAESFSARVASYDALVDRTSANLDNSFDFITRAYGDDREMLVFLTEITARKSIASFIDSYGSDSYFAHNDKLLVNKHRAKLVAEIESLGLDNDSLAQSAEADEALDSTDTAAYLPALKEYYDSAVFEYGFNSMCKMTLPQTLRGMTVLDIGCRRGKGALKLSDFVGDEGHVIGLDWSEDYLQDARNYLSTSWMQSGHMCENVDFRLGYPEALDSVGLGAASIDVVYVNSGINLAYDPATAFMEFGRVLKEDGLLICETVLADRERDKLVAEEAKRLGNSVQSAPSREEFESMLSKAGFEDIRYLESKPVAADCGYTDGYTVPSVHTDENAAFTATVCYARKR